MDMLSLHLIFFDFSQSCLIVLSVEPFTFFFHYWVFTAHNPSQRTELEKLHIEKGKQIYLYIFLYIHTCTSMLFYCLSIENPPFTLSFPLQSRYHKVHSDFISVSYNFLSSVRNLSLFSLIISTYSINPAFLTLAGLNISNQNTATMETLSPSLGSDTLHPAT